MTVKKIFIWKPDYQDFNYAYQSRQKRGQYGIYMPLAYPLLVVTYICPVIEFAVVLWCPYTVHNRARVERIQHLFTRYIAGFKYLS